MSDIFLIHSAQRASELLGKTPATGFVSTGDFREIQRSISPDDQQAGSLLVPILVGRSGRATCHVMPSSDIRDGMAAFCTPKAQALLPLAQA
jgi:hypothetical protein